MGRAMRSASCSPSELACLLAITTSKFSLRPCRFLAIAHPAKFQFQSGVFLLAARFADHARQSLFLPLVAQHLEHALQSVLQRQVVWVEGLGVARLVFDLVD